MPTPRPAVFLDRDDTINRNADLPPAAWARTKEGDLLDPEHVHLMPGARDAIASLKAAGYAVVVITNQGGVARGGGCIADIDACNDRLRQLLPASADDLETRRDIPAPLADSLIDACYAAPHHPEGDVFPFDAEHPWRKPGPGMVESACRELDLDPARSWMVGDKQRDLDAALAAGVPPERCILVASGSGTPDLTAAAERILAASRPSTPGATVTVSLRAPGATPLADARARDTVLASARAIAERTGVPLTELRADESSVTATLGASRLAALGFLAELRRLTNAWSRAKLGADLWPTTDHE